MFVFPKFIQVGLYSGGANIRDIYWVSYLGVGVYFLLGGVYIRGVYLRDFTIFE